MAYGFETYTSTGLLDMSSSGVKTALYVAGGTVSGSGTTSIPGFDSTRGVLLTNVFNFDPTSGVVGNVGLSWNNSTKDFSFSVGASTVGLLFMDNGRIYSPSDTHGVFVTNSSGEVTFDSNRAPLTIAATATSTGILYASRTSGLYEHVLPTGFFYAMALDNGNWGSWGLSGQVIPFPATVLPLVFISNQQVIDMYVLGFSSSVPEPTYGMKTWDSSGTLTWHSGAPLLVVPYSGLLNLTSANPTKTRAVDANCRYIMQSMPQISYTITVDFFNSTVQCTQQIIQGIVARTNDSTLTFSGRDIDINSDTAISTTTDTGYTGYAAIKNL